MKYPTTDLKCKVVEAHSAGNSITSLVNIFGFHRNTISRWIAIASKDPEFSRSHNPGSGRRSGISPSQSKRLIKIIEKPATDYGFETDFWTTRRLLRICKDNLKIRISKSALHRVLVKFEQSYKRPQRRYFEACADKQSNWISKDLAKIKKLLKTKKAILYFEDESSIDLTPVLAKTWGPIGKKVIQKVTANRGSVSAISAISTRGDLIFNIHKAGKRFGANDIINFLNQMLKQHPRRHLIVVMDQAPCHRAKKVKLFVESQARLNVFYLPPRSPEFNPDEKVWSHLKNHELKSHTAKTTDELRRLTRTKLRAMARDKRKVVGIFKRCEMANIYL